MGYLTTYNSTDFGSYQFTSLENIITQFQIAYVGENKLIPKLKKADVAFHAMRALQELSFDTFKSCKSQEITVSNSLQMMLPQDYVNYVKLTWSDSAGIEHVLYPATKTSNPTPQQEYVASNTAIRGLVFNGANFLNTNQTFENTLRSSFTISSWVKLEDGQAAADQSIVGSHDVYNSNQGFKFCVHGGKLRFFMLSVDISGQTTSADILDFFSDAIIFDAGVNDWKHVAVTLTRSGAGFVTPQFYVDGQPITGASTLGWELAEDNQINYISNVSAYIGATSNNSIIHSPFSGSIDEFAIWNEALDDAAIEVI